MDAEARAGRVTMICPNLKCRRTLCAPESSRGQSVRCPYCNLMFRVPLKEQGEQSAAKR